MTTTYRADIDALRGLSVLVVVIFHAFPEYLPGGFIGVDVFFVISGYLITGILLREHRAGNFSILRFYDRRIRRLLPALNTILAFCLLTGWLILFSDELQQLGRHVSRAAIFVLNFQYIRELGYFDVESHYKPLLHLWSLSIEEQYYLLWPMLLALLARAKWSAFNVVLIVTALSFLLNLIFVENYPDQVFFHSATRFWELGVGSLLAAYEIERPDARELPAASALVGIAAIAVTAVIINSEMTFPGYIALIPTFAAALIIRSKSTAFNFRWLVKLGLISYPLYLWHWVIISFTYIYLGEKPNVALMLLAIIASLALSYATFKYIERIRHLEFRYTSLLLLLFLLAIAAAGYQFQVNAQSMPRQHVAHEAFHLENLERTSATDDHCLSMAKLSLSEEPEFDYCRLEKDANFKNTVAILGDSHAHVMHHGITSIAEAHSHNLLTIANSSCPPLPGFRWGRNEIEVSQCKAKIEQMYSLLETIPEISKLILVTRGPVYIHGETDKPRTEAGVRKNLTHFIQRDRQNYEALASGFSNALQRISEMENIQTVLVLLENPELDFLPKEKIPRPFQKNLDYQSNTGVDYSLHQKRMEKYHAIVRDAAGKKEKVLVIDLADHLCDSDFCRYKINGEFLYSDEDHFSKAGSSFVAQKLEIALFGKEK